MRNDPAPPPISPSQQRDALTAWRGMLIVLLIGAAGVGWLSRPAHVAPLPAPDVVAWRMNVNAAGTAELELLPGIGPATAKRILAERRRGPYESADDLQRVNGVGEYTAARIAEHVAFGPVDGSASARHP